MRNKFGKWITEKAKSDDKILLLVGDIGFGIFDEIDTKTSFGRFLRLIRPFGLAFIIVYTPFLHYTNLEPEEKTVYNNKYRYYYMRYLDLVDLGDK